MKAFDVSVIVTTRNEEKHIADCLDSVKLQDYPQDRIEIIVVDNDSSDQTKRIAFRYTPLVFNHGPERSAQRNFGISQSRGEYILYLDADMILSQRVVSECMAKCEEEKAVGLYIPERVIGNGFWTKIRDFERGFYNATCIDAVRFVRREAAVRVKGFDENLNGPEDWDFDRKIRAQGEVKKIDSPIFHNETGFTLRSYLGKKMYYANKFEAYVQKWGRSDPVAKKQLGFWYRYCGVFTEKGKWKKLMQHPLLALGMYFLRLSVGGGYFLFRLKVLKPPQIITEPDLP